MPYDRPNEGCAVPRPELQQFFTVAEMSAFLFSERGFAGPTALPLLSYHGYIGQQIEHFTRVRFQNGRNRDYARCRERVQILT